MTAVMMRLPGFGKADHCDVATVAAHRPVPVRFIFHHVQPQNAGGETTAANLVQLCDNCHYTVHRLLWMMRNGTPVQRPVNRVQLRLARQGLAACQAAGTVADITNEG